MKTTCATLLLSFFLLGNLLGQKPLPILLVAKPSESKVDVLVGGKFFTSYIYPKTSKKPVLWPVYSPSGNAVTRSFPLEKKAGERTDHPHHLGIWLNYGDVNGLDFWNNSDAIVPDKAKNYGTIIHRSVDRVLMKRKNAELAVSAEWNDFGGNKLLGEKTTFVFSATPTCRIIDRTTTLTATHGDVSFKDNKEGVFAIRVASELEMPAEGPAQLTDAQGNVTRIEKPDLTKVTGNYLSSEGITGAGVWGTRGRWMELTGQVNGEDVTIIIIDHPENVGYPTYWHARGYGLFAANTLGQKAMSEGKNELNFLLKKGESVTLKYRLMVITGHPDTQTINKWANGYAKK